MDLFGFFLRNMKPSGEMERWMKDVRGNCQAKKLRKVKLFTANEPLVVMYTWPESGLC